jgi:(5-formylfuran-3-yl)methyl phosphate synthase
MTRMLASVMDTAEADVAVHLGADIVDLKDPAAGAMAAVDVSVAKAVVAEIAGRRETSATLGDPPYEGSALFDRARAFAAAKVNILKLAVDSVTVERFRDRLAELAHEARLVGVMFADDEPQFDILPRLAALGFAGAMLDTKRKGAGRLLDHVDIAGLEAFCSRCRSHGLTSGLAGSLEAPDAPRLLLVRPDVLGFRGALCRNHDRTSRLDPQSFALVRDLIPRERPDGDGSPKIDWRLLARGIIGGRDHESEIDHVFVRDFVVAAHIGAYDFERAAPQRLVFDVEVAVRRGAGHADDMRSVFSYDIILDSIRLAVGRGHVQFVETLAEEVADVVLKHPRVRSLRVSVRKIDVIDGSVGVAISRDRPSAAADSHGVGAVARAAVKRE